MGGQLLSSAAVQRAAGPAAHARCISSQFGSTVGRESWLRPAGSYEEIPSAWVRPEALLMHSCDVMSRCNNDFSLDCKCVKAGRVLNSYPDRCSSVSASHQESQLCDSAARRIGMAALR